MRSSGRGADAPPAPGDELHALREHREPSPLHEAPRRGHLHREPQPVRLEADYGLPRT
jgi:hypothetical protein